MPIRPSKNIRIKKVTILPKCDMCEERASYDTKTVHGPWANLCKNHYSDYGDSINCTMFDLLEKTDEGLGKKGNAIHISGSMISSIIAVACPFCDCERGVEPDASYDFTCEECQATVHVDTWELL